MRPSSNFNAKRGGNAQLRQSAVVQNQTNNNMLQEAYGTNVQKEAATSAGSAAHKSNKRTSSLKDSSLK